MSVIPVLGGDGSTSNSRHSNWMHVERLGFNPRHHNKAYTYVPGTEPISVVIWQQAFLHNAERFYSLSPTP
jgi:hypothetical protein